MNRHLLISSAVATFLFSLFILANLGSHSLTNVEAQISCNGLPETFREQGFADPVWSKFTSVKVYFQRGDFTPTQRGTIRQGFEAWDARRVQNCSSVSFDDNAYAERDTPPTTSQVGAFAWVFKGGSSETQMFRDSATGKVFSEVTVGEFDLGGVLLQITKHEVGHDFNLAHCAGCTSIMDELEDDTDITTCDDASVKRVYCPTPTPTPTPTPGTCNGTADWSTYPTTGCASGFVYSGSICTRSDSFQTQCSRFGGYDYDSCNCLGGCDPEFPCSPILIDVAGDGFALTDAAGGVLFDVSGDGLPERRAWTAASSDDAWLALDRNGNGLIDGGRELFGSATVQPPPPAGEAMNGFLALAQYDGAGLGGNGDGVVDSRDAAFASLRLWQDTDHDGVSAAGELHPLPELGIAALDLNYKTSKRTDRHGNRFRYRAKVEDVHGAQAGRWAWDVFLVAGP